MIKISSSLQSPHLIAGRPVRMFGVAVAGLTAMAARHVPGVRRAAVAVLTDHVRKAVTLSAAAVAVTVARCRTAGGIAAQLVTNTLCGHNNTDFMNFPSGFLSKCN